LLANTAARQRVLVGLVAAAAITLSVRAEPARAIAPENVAARGGRGAGDAAQDRVNPVGSAMKGFLDRVNEYLQLTKKLDDGLPKLGTTDNPARTDAHQKGLADRIREARKLAKRGDIFGDAEPYIKEVILKDSAERRPKDKKAAMEEVPKYDPPRVNAEYPEKSPLATVPPLMLTNLPRLPEGVEYRFMGRDFVLRDVKTNLIVDFINGATPDVKR
jgi:hypothetical protein